MLSSSRAVSPSPAMSAAIASRRRPLRIASAIYGSSSTSNTRTRGGYDLAHIVGVSKIAYALATPRCLKWRRALQQASTNSAPPDPHPKRPRRRPARRHSGARRGPRLPVAGILVVAGVIAPDGVLALHGGITRRPSPQ